MEKGKTRLVEDGNTIYEIDLDCMKRKQMLRQKEAANTKTDRERLLKKEQSDFFLKYLSHCAIIKNNDYLIRYTIRREKRAKIRSKRT